MGLINIDFSVFTGYDSFKDKYQ